MRMDMFLLISLVLIDIHEVFTIQEIPADRTFEVCTGSRVTMTFEGANSVKGNFKSWHFQAIGQPKEVDVAYEQEETGTSFTAVDPYKEHGLEKIGKLGIVIPDISAEDSGWYRFSDDKTFRYNVTVQDPCLNATSAAPQDDKTCLDINCITKATFQKLVIKDINISENFYTLCGTSPTMVTCVVERGGQMLTNETIFNLNSTATDQGLGAGEIAVITVASVVGLLAIIGVGIWCERKDNSRGFHNPLST